VFTPDARHPGTDSVQGLPMHPIRLIQGRSPALVLGQSHLLPVAVSGRGTGIRALPTPVRVTQSSLPVQQAGYQGTPP